MSETTYDGMHITKQRGFDADYSVPDGLQKTMVYLLSLFLPIGLFTGMFYSTKPGEQSKLFGRNCFILSITPIILTITATIIVFLSMAVIFMLKY